MPVNSLAWCVARDPDAVHALLVTCDAKAAAETGTPAPDRRQSSTEFLVAAGVVHVVLVDDAPVATVTVGPYPSFDADGLPPAETPWYMQRLAVLPDRQGSLLGVSAVRHAMATARAGGATALRAEANPDLPGPLALLLAVGFVRYSTDEHGPARRTFLQASLVGSAP